ncbi:DNA-binding protein [Sorangium sp. So ce1335]|uniref:DNA-binding protein n=1 Tax=Sorangium sp. So ce1335 TaxID=3133335 RepID=UPI003F5F7EB5
MLYVLATLLLAGEHQLPDGARHGVSRMPSRTKEQPQSSFPKGIGKPAQRALASVGVSRLDQVTRFTEAQLMALHGMGPKAIGLIKAVLQADGKTLARGE